MMNIADSEWSRPWTLDDRTTQHQAAQAETDLADWLAGAPHASFDAFKEIAQPILRSGLMFLEVASGAGYYKAVAEAICPGVVYYGVDISPAMVAYASQRFGYQVFSQARAEQLPFADRSFDMVDLAAVIQHLPDHRPAIREAVRVSRDYVLLHRVQATTGPTNEFRNPAYGTELPTREFNEAELLADCDEAGLILESAVRWGDPQKQFNASYLFRKRQ